MKLIKEMMSKCEVKYNNKRKGITFIVSNL